jgi:nucleoside phosphorylase
LMPANAGHFKMDQNRGPVIWRDSARKPAQVITTDFFAFDDADDHYGLRAYDSKARAVEMDDAALALACSELDAPPSWISVRNASDPQMTGGDLETEKKNASAIYEKYGYWTSIGSAVTCWALAAGL